MAKPAVPLSTVLEDTEFTKLINEDRFIMPPQFNEAYQRLSDFSECVIVGSPRSGKTYLALYTAKQFVDKHYKEALYLDFNQVQEASSDFEKIAELKLSPGSLLIIDNWHGRLECQDELNRLLALPDWKPIKLLYLMTHFPSGEDNPRHSPPSLIHSPTEVIQNPINTNDSLLELAIRMINKKAAHQYRNQESVPKLIEDGDVERILFNVPSKYKKLRGNLRYLMWRLEAWNPRTSRLEDVGVKEVMNTLFHHLVKPAEEKNILGSLQKVATLAQWEVPYQLPPGGNVPKEFLGLRELNLIYKVSSFFDWYMDSTDAYLFLEYLWGEAWPQNTEKLLKEYLEQSPYQVPIVLARIMSQAEKEVKRNLLIGLLKSNKILESEGQFTVDQIRYGNLGVHYAQRWADILLSDVTNDNTERQKRVNVVNALLPKEVGESLGARAQATSLQTTIRLLHSLKKDPDLSRHFVTTFLASFGEENLRNRINEGKSASARRNVLRSIGIFDSKLSERLTKAVKVKPETRSVQDTVWWLESGTRIDDARRWQNIDFLEDIGEEEVNHVIRLQHPLTWIQRLLLNAHWLAPEEAKRIAAMVPDLWPELNKKDAKYRDLSFLVTNLRYVNPGVAADFVDLLLHDVNMFDTMLSKKSTQNHNNDLGKMLITIENTLPGSTRQFCEIHMQHLLQLVPTLDDKSLHQVLVAMQLFAPDSLKTAFASQDVQQRLKHVQNENQRWTRNGILTANGLSSLISPDTSNSGELGSVDTEWLTFALYGLQNFLGMSFVVSTLKHLAAVIPLNPDVAGQLIQVGRYSPPWITTQQVIGNLKAEMTPSLDPRTTAFQYIVMADFVMGGTGLKWSAQWFKKQMNAQSASANIRGLIAAGFERLLLLKTTPGDPIVQATLNRTHPMVRTVQQQIRTVLAPLTEQDLTLPQWDEALGGKMLLREADRWRYRLLRAGRVRCRLGEHSDRFEVRFTLVREPSQDWIRQLVLGESALA